MNTIQWLSSLVGFDTTSRNSNLDLIEHVKDWLTQQKIDCRLTHDETGKKANLFATIAAYDKGQVGGLILSGHTDVVPVDGQVWKTNPFELVKAKDRVFGRGTSDMKGFIAVMLALVPEFQKMKLNKPLHFAFSYDEEVGCKGAPGIIKDFQKIGIKPNACIVGEPSNMRPVVAHKGIQVYRCQVHGLAAHSSLTPDGCNAIDYAAHVISAIRRLADEIREKGPFEKDYDVPFTSISTNGISGGTANNIIPATCEFAFEFRNLPSVSPGAIIDKITGQVKNEILPRMRKEYAKADIGIEELGKVPSFEAELDSAIYELARALLDEKELVKVAYATEAGIFQKAGVPTIICGPGSIEQAHRPDEFVTLEQLTKCEEFLRKVVPRFCAG